MTTHVMVDIETYGTTPGSAIRSIGAVVFDPVSGILPAHDSGFYVNIIPDSCKAVGLTLDPRTVEWWAKQSPEAQEALEADQKPLWQALELFYHWWIGANGSHFWANDPDFDKVLLDAAYEACGQTPPWSYWMARSCRTVYELADVRPNRGRGVHHNALDDAHNQAEAVVRAYRVLRLKQPVWRRIFRKAA